MSRLPLPRKPVAPPRWKPFADPPPCAATSSTASRSTPRRPCRARLRRARCAGSRSHCGRRTCSTRSAMGSGVRSWPRSRSCSGAPPRPSCIGTARRFARPAGTRGNREGRPEIGWNGIAAFVHRPIEVQCLRMLIRTRPRAAGAYEGQVAWSSRPESGRTSGAGCERESSSLTSARIIHDEGLRVQACISRNIRQQGALRTAIVDSGRTKDAKLAPRSENSTPCAKRVRPARFGASG